MQCLEIKISVPPAEVKLNVPIPGSKSEVPKKSPVVYTLSKTSIAIEFPLALPVPPKSFAQIFVGEQH